MIDIKYNDLLKLENMANEVRENVLKKALRIAIKKTTKYSSSFASLKVRESKLINLKKKYMGKRVFSGHKLVATDINSMSGHVTFSHFNEYASLFPIKEDYFFRGTRSYKSFMADVLGKQVGNLKKTFLSPHQHMTIKRLSRDSDDLYKFAPENSSLSDVLRKDDVLLNSLIIAAKTRYEKEISRQISRALYAMEKGLKSNGKK